MLISFDHRFVFVANTKAGSTTVEALLASQCEIALTRDPHLKHMPIDDVHKLFARVFRRAGVAPEEFFSFAIMRDPLDWIVSWFNYRSRAELLSRPRKLDFWTHDVTFDEFCDELVTDAPRPFAQIGFQSRRFGDRVGVDAILDYARLSDGFHQISERIGVDLSQQITTERHNVSAVQRQTTANLTERQRSMLRERFADDCALYEKVADASVGVLRQPQMAVISDEQSPR